MLCREKGEQKWTAEPPEPIFKKFSCTHHSNVPREANLIFFCVPDLQQIIQSQVPQQVPSLIPNVQARGIPDSKYPVVGLQMSGCYRQTNEAGTCGTFLSAFVGFDSGQLGLSTG